jgi:hypothetical protein
MTAPAGKTGRGGRFALLPRQPVKRFGKGCKPNSVFVRPQPERRESFV